MPAPIDPIDLEIDDESNPKETQNSMPTQDSIDDEFELEVIACDVDDVVPTGRWIRGASVLAG